MCLLVYTCVAAAVSAAVLTGARSNPSTLQVLIIAVMTGLLWPVILVGLAELALLVVMSTAFRVLEAWT